MIASLSLGSRSSLRALTGARRTMATAPWTTLARDALRMGRATDYAAPTQDGESSSRRYVRHALTSAGDDLDQAFNVLRELRAGRQPVAEEEPAELAYDDEDDFGMEGLELPVVEVVPGTVERLTQLIELLKRRGDLERDYARAREVETNQFREASLRKIEEQERTITALREQLDSLQGQLTTRARTP
mmetsp:Transcript_99304/g.265572  ORF Transcript_99304/g.265572 Transcript_99304/m.265572 type:complete len:188 (-) Transcript_99304:273-836(-)